MNNCLLCESLLDEKLTFCDLLTLKKPKAKACDACFENSSVFQRNIALSAIVTEQMKSAQTVMCGQRKEKKFAIRVVLSIMKL